MSDKKTAMKFLPGDIPAFLTVADVAKLLYVCDNTVRRWINRDDLKAVRPGGKNAPLRIAKAALEEYLQGKVEW